jgi:hypothetical protein
MDEANPAQSEPGRVLLRVLQWSWPGALLIAVPVLFWGPSAVGRVLLFLGFLVACAGFALIIGGSRANARSVGVNLTVDDVAFSRVTRQSPDEHRKDA